jgi:hypothetical protein
MGILDHWFREFTRPLREIRSKWHGIKNVKDGLQGDAKRIKERASVAKKEAANAKKKAKEATEKAKGASDQAKGAAGQAQGAWGQAQGQAQAAGGMVPGRPPPGAPPGPPPGGGPVQAVRPGMPAPPGMPPPMGGPPMPMGGPPMGAPGMAYGAPGGYGAAMGGPPQAGQRTMAIMAGGQQGPALAWFVPLKGPQRGQLISLKPQSVIGKDPTCEVFINDPFLSGRHATVRAHNGVYVLEDHSTNGTWVNDKKVSRHELVDNDFVKVGQTLMKFKAL